MKSLKFITVVLTTLLSTFAYSAVKIVNTQQIPLYYKLENSAQEATLCKCENGEYKGNIVIPDCVTSNGRNYKVTAIEDSAFFQSKDLVEITIPQHMLEIGGHAFKGCRRLKIVNFNAVNCKSASKNIGNRIFSAFEDCKSIVAVNFGANVIEIPEYTFWGCIGLSEITIPEKVQKIGGAAFIDCSSLSKVTFNAIKCVNMFTTAKGQILPAFIGAPITDIEFGPLVTAIPDYAFYGCQTISTITIPENVTMIGGGSFRNCSHLASVQFNAKHCTVANTSEEDNILPAFNNNAIRSVTFGKSVTTIPDYLFWGCRNLIDITWNEQLVRIGNSAFYGCSALQEITIPATVESIGGKAFANCRSLHTIHFNAINCVNMVSMYNGIPMPAFDKMAITNIDFGNQVENIPDYAFYGCKKLKTFVMPQTVKHIGYKSFFGCEALQSVTIPENVRTIGGFAFYGCINMTSVEFNAIKCVSTSQLEDKKMASAFQDCRNIATVTFSDSVQVIPDYIFDGCKQIKTINIPQSVNTIGNMAFNNCSNLNDITFDAAECKETTAFKDKNITSLTLGEHVKILPNNIFDGCGRLSNITLPNTLEAIGQYAFRGCTGIKEITIPENLKVIEGGAFESCRNLMIVNYNALDAKTIVYYNDSTDIIPIFQNSRVHQVVFGNKVKNIPNHLFSNCDYLEDIKFNKELESIGQYSFANNKLLKGITIPEKVKYIGGGAFENCKILGMVYYNAINCTSSASFEGDSAIYPFMGKNHIEEIIIGKKVQNIPEGLFYNSKNITSIIIPKGVKSIGGCAFSNCPKLATVFFDAPMCMNTHSTINNKEFGPFEGSDRIAEFIFNSKMKAIPDYLLQNCSNVKKITIPESVTEIGNFAFKNCSDLKRITLPEKLVTIGDGAFEGSGLTTIYFGEFVSSIAEDAFKRCKFLSSIRIKRQNKYFVVEDGKLYSSDMQTVVLEPAK